MNTSLSFIFGPLIQPPGGALFASPGLDLSSEGAVPVKQGVKP